MSECKTPTEAPERSIERWFAEMSFTPLLPAGVTIEIERAAEWAIAGAQLGTLVGEAAGSLAAAEVNENGSIKATIFQTEGTFTKQELHQDEEKKPGTWHWPERV